MEPQQNIPARPFSDLKQAARRIRAALLRLAERYYREPLRFVAEARRLVASAEPQLAEHLRAGQLLGFFKSAQQTVKAAGVRPRTDVTPLADDHGRLGPIPLPPASPEAYPSPVLVNVAFGANWLQQRIPFERAEFDKLDEQAKRVAFTAAGVVGDAAVGKLRDRLAVAVEKGQTLAEFTRETKAALDVSALTPAQLETLYRTHVGRAQTAGKMRVLSSPLVGDQFPYLLYSAVHDSRVRPEHKAMETIGLNGTAVYRRDDPIWNLFLPPWDWNCRCEVIPLDKETAAQYGVVEAMEWVRSGEPPGVPTWVELPPWRPPDGWIPTSSALELLKA